MSMLMLGVVVLVYMFLIAWLGYIGYKRTKDASDYLLGGRKTNPIIMALSYGATFISASAIVGFGGFAATFGMGIQWLCMLNMLMGVIVAFIFFGRKTRKIGEQHNARTFSQLLGLHYGSRTIQVFIAVVIFIGMPLYAAVVMKGGAVFIEQMFHVNLDLALLIFTLIVSAYVITGGIKGVLYTDALQAVIMFACMTFMLFWFYHMMGMSFTEANRELTDIAPLVPERFKALGHQGWTRMPVSGSPQWYTLVTSLIMGVGIGCLAQPQLAVRFMMVESTKQLNRGVLIGCLFIFFTVGSIYHVGALSNLYFLQTDGVVASEMIGDMDKIIPLFINKAMPAWFGALFMLCILSASMSTLSAQFHTMGAAFGADIFPRLGRAKNPNSTLGVRFGVLCSILLSYVICYVLSAGIIARGTALFMGVCAVTFLPAYFCALYWKKATREGALASLIVGASTSIFAMVFLHKAEAASIGVCKALFGKEVLIDVYPWFVIDPILFALPLSVLAIVVVSLFTQKKGVEAEV
ncbi:sodium:solute symporter family protein [Parabacteroides sp. 52]|uniref:sodium:solute symporter family protein n=1 Tax=unclassified Parabacteroides TaxID=2649774 RepID=UPI0013D4F33E|nr:MULTISPECIES: sodium:solute symporter family protein [unclassified Parabacteroides]MDH6534227.1 SSS family solute:Na+ symporter [Parabacteroides sp. PM5-20]NDV55388.1 sodium:solute symporter family protein [Parabacteroides sp. 52]